MRTILTILITTAIVLPSMTFALTGWANPLKQYESLNIDYYRTGDVVKVYDHEENVVCYLFKVNSQPSISCVNDNQ